MLEFKEKSLVSVNGHVTAAEDAVIPALDRGFLFGDAVFETLVGFHDKLLDADRHFARLRVSAEAVGIEIPWSDAELRFELSGLAEQVPALKKNVRLVVTRGIGMGMKAPTGMRPNKIVYCFKAAEEPRSTYEEGFALKRVVQKSTERGAAPKTANYQKSVVAVSKAAAEGFNDILWTNADGEITESSIANVFFIQRDGDNITFVTPPAMSGILLGITRETMIRLLKQATLPIEERIIYADELPRFDEAFLTSTVRGLVPVNRIDGHRLHTTRPNSVYRHVRRLHAAWVTTQVGFPVDWATGVRKA